MKKRTHKRLSYSNSNYLCPGCNDNSFLYEETQEEEFKLSFLTISKKVVLHRLYCDKCNTELKKKDLLPYQKTIVKSDSIIKTTERETIFSKDKLTTTTKIKRDYSEYIPKLENKSLYYEMILMLMIFIERNQNGVNIEGDFHFKFLADQSDQNIYDIYGEDLEERIYLKFKECIIEFNQSDLNLILKNSLGILKGHLFIAPEIEELYFNIFRLMEIGELSHQSIFDQLR